ncbi:MAG: transposase [Candidatus Marinimicrobia bacterium]|nr:transposase [Candidatus Neomarinimicrobiota bacterium]
MSPISDVEKRVKEIRRKTRRKYSAEDKIRIVLEGLRGEMTIAELCRREGIVQNLYYKWSRDFLEAGKKRLSGDVEREANSTEVGALRSENRHLKQLYADLALENDMLKKSLPTRTGSNAVYAAYSGGEVRDHSDGGRE